MRATGRHGGGIGGVGIIATAGRLAVAFCAMALATGTVRAATVYWTNTDATATWTAPDSTHFSTAKIGTAGSPATYNNGDTAYFGNGASLPSTPSTISIAAGGVSPATITMYSPRGVNTYMFNIGEDNALGSGSFDTDYTVSTTFNNTKGSEATLANNFIYANSYSLVFTGGNFRLTGAVSGGANNGVTFKPASSTTVTVANAISGSGLFFSVKPSGTGGVVRLNGSSSSWLLDANADVTIQVGANNALGPSASLASQQSDVRSSTKLEAVSSVTLSNNFISRGMSVICSADLALNGLFGTLGNAWVSIYKYGASTLTLGGTNGTTHYGAVSIREGVVRLSKADALGISPVILSGGVLELGAANFTNALNSSPQFTDGNTVGWVNGGGSYIGGGFSAYGANRIVNLFGLGTPSNLTWALNGFVPAGQALIFGSANANAQLDFQNPINLGTAVRTIQVNDNTNSTADRAILSGVISGTTGSGLLKTGNGTLALQAANTYVGITTVSNGTLVINGTIASTTNVTVNPLGTLGGTGTLSGAVSLDSGATIAPGDPTGTLTIPSLTATNGAAVLRTTVNPAGSCGMLAVTGALAITNLQLVVTGTMPASGYVVLAQGNPLTGPFQSVNLPPKSGIVYVGNEVRLRVVSKGLVLAIQ